MIRLSLHPHATTATTEIRALDVVLQRCADGGLRADFAVDADHGALVVPEAVTAAFRDGLWRHTCFELFAAGEGIAYREFNFSPSTEYAIYDFDAYRGGMRVVDAPHPPAIDIGRGGLSVSVCVPPDLIPLDPASRWRFGVAAVVEERGGVLSYWAAHHPARKPDFHDADGFVVSLAPEAAREDG